MFSYFSFFFDLSLGLVHGLYHALNGCFIDIIVYYVNMYMFEISNVVLFQKKCRLHSFFFRLHVCMGRYVRLFLSCLYSILV